MNASKSQRLLLVIICINHTTPRRCARVRMLPLAMADLAKGNNIGDQINGGWSHGGWSGRVDCRGLEDGRKKNRLTSHLRQWGRRGGSARPPARRRLRVHLRDANWCLLRLGGRASVRSYRERVVWFPVSLQYPSGIGIFSFLLIKKSLDTYGLRIGQYPCSIQYPISVRRQSAISALPRASVLSSPFILPNLLCALVEVHVFAIATSLGCKICSFSVIQNQVFLLWFTLKKNYDDLLKSISSMDKLL
jgi:hypothetical protein